MSKQSKFGLDVARKVSVGTEDDWLALFEQLRRDRQLSTALCQINALLSEPEHRPIAIAALKRMGLWTDMLIS